LSAVLIITDQIISVCLVQRCCGQRRRGRGRETETNGGSRRIGGKRRHLLLPWMRLWVDNLLVTSCATRLNPFANTPNTYSLRCVASSWLFVGLVILCVTVTVSIILSYFL